MKYSRKTRQVGLKTDTLADSKLAAFPLAFGRGHPSLRSPDWGGSVAGRSPRTRAFRRLPPITEGYRNGPLYRLPRGALPVRPAVSTSCATSWDRVRAAVHQRQTFCAERCPMMQQFGPRASGKRSSRSRPTPAQRGRRRSLLLWGGGPPLVALPPSTPPHTAKSQQPTTASPPFTHYCQRPSCRRTSVRTSRSRCRAVGRQPEYARSRLRA
jgi:hypothetical protein